MYIKYNRIQKNERKDILERTAIVLATSFQSNLDKQEPECQTIQIVAASRDDRAGGGDSQNTKTCKVPVKSPSSPTHQHSVSTSQMPFLLPSNSVIALKAYTLETMAFYLTPLITLLQAVNTTLNINNGKKILIQL